MLILLQGFKIEPIAIEGLVILKKSFHSTPPPPHFRFCHSAILLYFYIHCIYIYSYTRGASHTPLYPLPICLSLREGVLESSKGGGGGRMRPPKGFSLLLSSLQPSLQLFSPVIWTACRCSTVVLCNMYMYYVSSLPTQLFWTLLPYIGAL